MGRLYFDASLLNSFVLYMRSFLCLVIALVASEVLFAHPGIGLVYDGHRYIYYTDLNHIWKLNTESGKREIVVQDVHSHELFLDKMANLFGEHYWYDETNQSFKNYIWKLDSKKIFSIIRKEISGENTDFGFVRDSLFRSYSIEKYNAKFSIIRTDSTDIENLSSAELQSPGWKYLSKEGTLYFTDEETLYVLQNDQLLKLATNLASSRFPFSLQADDHSLYGIWQGQDQNIYLANYGGRLVKRINQQGEVTTVLKSGFFWSPVNGVFDKDKQLWLMESSVFGQVRLRKIKESLKPLSRPFFLENVFIAVFSLFLITGLYDLILKRNL